MLFGSALMLGGIVEFAKSAVAVLIAILAIYLAIRLLGKVAKFVVTIVVVVALFYFLSTSGILGELLSTVKSSASLVGGIWL